VPAAASGKGNVSPDDELAAVSLRDRKLAALGLAVCEVCFLEGPAARLQEHLRKDHQEFYWPEPGGHIRREEWLVAIPGRFRFRLERIARQSGRTVGQVVAGALDDQGLGRQRRPEASQPQVPASARSTPR
jgi:hypothetical protein